MNVDFALNRPPRDARIVVAMSGGVDSSVVAALAARTGAEVIGVTLQLYDHGEAVRRTGSCCAGQDIYDARTVADRLGIAHYVLDYESQFRTSVIDRFADEYAAGRTPVPCSLCNQGVKFTDLIAFSRQLGADCVAHSFEAFPPPFSGACLEDEDSGFGLASLDPVSLLLSEDFSAAGLSVSALRGPLPSLP